MEVDMKLRWFIGAGLLAFLAVPFFDKTESPRNKRLDDAVAFFGPGSKILRSDADVFSNGNVCGRVMRGQDNDFQRFVLVGDKAYLEKLDGSKFVRQWNWVCT
jgi:hypothetical protein